MKRLIRKGTLAGVGACLAVVLAACGGGGSGGAAEEATVSVRVEGLSAGSMTLVDDRGHTAVLSANGVQTFARMAPGTTFTPSIASQPSNQVCALDAGARTAASGLELLVRCDAGLLTTSGLRSFSVDQMVVMDTLEAGAVSSASLGGQTLTLAEAATGGFTFRVPALTAGAHELRAVVNGRAFTTTLDITVNPLTGAPDAFLRTAASQALADISARLADPATTEEERVALRQLQTALGGLDGALATASTEDIRNMARLLAANDPARWLAAGGAVSSTRVGSSASGGRVSAAAVEPNAALCDRYSNSLGFSMAGTVAFMAMTNIAMTSGVGAPITALTTYAFIRMIKQTMDNAGGVVDHCVGVVGMPILKAIRTAPQNMNLSSGSVAPYSLGRMQGQAGTGMAFNHGEAGVLEVQLQKALLAEVTDRVLKTASRLVDLHGSLSALVADVVTLPGGDLMARLRTLQRSFSQPAQALRLEGLPSGITGDITPMLDRQGLPTGQYEVVFRSSVAPTSSQPVPFSFRLRETEADYLGPVIGATLQVPLTPVAADLAFETNGGTPLSAHLTATHATGFALVSQPAEGTLTLTDPSSGAFTYTPSMGYSGTVAFTYRAFNASATSQTATVVIAVLSDEVWCTLTDNSGSPAGTVSVNRRCYRALLTGADPDEELWIRYVPDVLGDLQFTGRAEDYLSLMEHVYVPVGLSARVSTESASYDPSNNAFTFDKAYGYYDTSDGTAASPSFTYSAQDDDLRQQTQRLRALLVRNPLSGLLMVDNLQRALVQRAYFADAVVRVDRMEHVSLTLQSLSAGVPTYATTVTRCSRPTSLQSGGYVLTGGADWTVERLTFVNKTETSRTASTSVTCPLSDTTLLDSIAPARGLNNLSFDWRNP